MVIKIIFKAYQEKNLIGSCFTAPLRAYHAWFQHKVDDSESPWERIAWKVSWVASGLFVYVALGVVALIGVAINACLIPPENGYSLWARLNGVPESTEKFCEAINSTLSAPWSKGGKVESGSGSFSSNRNYTYSLSKQLHFNIRGVFDVHETPSMGEVDGETVPSLISEDEIHLQRVMPHVSLIQNIIRALARKHGWHPEMQCIKINGEGVVSIPIPDHIPLDEF